MQSNKIYPPELVNLLKEESKKAIFSYPKSIQKVILRFQVAWQILEGGAKLTREEIALHMLVNGLEKVKEEVKAMNDKFTKEQKANFNLKVLQKK